MNEVVVGSNPIDPPISGTVAERLMHFAVYEDDDGSSPFGPANLSVQGEKPYVCVQESKGL